MSSMGVFFVLGPPVQSAEQILDVVQEVIKRILGLTLEFFTLTHVEGPVRYDSGWVPERKRKILRSGMAVADLWTGQVKWKDPLHARSFSVVVMDKWFVQQRSGQRQEVPGFEIFVVRVLHGDKAGVDRVYEWFANGKKRLAKS